MSTVNMQPSLRSLLYPSFLSGLHDTDDVARHVHCVHVFDQMKECVFQRLAKNLTDVGDRILRDHNAFAQDEYIGANFLDHLQHMRTIEDELALLSERLDKVLEDKRRSYIQS